jgi:glycosyltransferase involved in cell wall biosynthesis
MPTNRAGILFHGYYPIDPRVRRQAEALASAGYDVDVVCLRRTARTGQLRERRTETINGVRVHRLPLERKRGGYFRYAYEYAALTMLGSVKLAQLHFSRRFQVVHIHNMPDLLVLAGLVPKWTGAKLVLDVRDPMAELYQAKRFAQAGWVTRLLNWQQRISCQFANKVVSVSEPMRENLQRKGVPSDKIFIVHNYPEQRFLSDSVKMTVWPRHPDEPTLLYCGTITDQYRLDIAVRALAIASKSIPRLRLQIAGEGDRLANVRQLAADLGVADRVEVLGIVSAEKIPGIMANADIGISSLEANVFGALCLPNKILEYISRGLPVVSSRTETMVRYIPDDTVFYFEPGSSEDMARQISRIWVEPDLVRRTLAKARALLGMYAWEGEKSRLESFYGQLLAQPGVVETAPRTVLTSPDQVD